jgi:hypothetical protein
VTHFQDDALTERLSFHGVTDEVGRILRDNKAYTLRLLPNALDAFYRHVARHQSVARFFTSPAHIGHAKQKQFDHWGLLLDGNFDADYVASVRKIGEVHHRIGLEPRWYIGGYNFLLRSLISMMAIEDFGGDLVATRDALDATPIQQAITSAVMLDMDCAIDAYISVKFTFLD